MQWCSPRFEAAFKALQAGLQGATWPGPPTGFHALTPPRPMRAVLQGVMDASGVPTPVVVKWSRPDRLGDHVSRQVRGGKGVREGRVLRGLEAAGVPAVRALAYSDEGGDVLVTAAVAGLAALPAGDDVDAATLRALARLVAAAHAAGLRHPDLHAGNLGIADGLPLLVDLGSARLGPPLNERQRVRALASLRHALLESVRRSQRLRALRAYLHAAGDADPRGSARALAGGIEARALVIRRRFRRGRDRRATRSGRHFVAFTGPEGAAGIRRSDDTDEAFEVQACAWLAAPPRAAASLKAGGRVLRVACTAPSGDARALVLKYLAPVASGRLPRAVQTFRRAYALQVRGLPVAPPLAAVGGSRGSLYIAAWVDGVDLHALWAPGTREGYASLPLPEQRRFLARLGRMLRALHDAEVTHRDLKPPNLLAVPTPAGLCPLLVDLDGVRIRKGPVGWKRRARDLARLDAGLAARRTDRLRVLQAYWRPLPRPPVSQRAFLSHLAAVVRRKRGPSGLPR